jgi:hypothetical protein
VSSIADFVSSLREHNARALDRLLLLRFGGKVGRGLALQLWRRRDDLSGRLEFLCAPGLTRYSQDSETPSETWDNVGANRREYRAWT